MEGCRRILADEFADYPEQALYMIGEVDEAHEKRKQLMSAAGTESTAEAAPSRRAGRRRHDDIAGDDA